jgi:hypothetical protein
VDSSAGRDVVGPDRNHQVRQRVKSLAAQRGRTNESPPLRWV